MRKKLILGIIIDVTEGVLRSRRLEKERNFDALTGIYNRRGLDDKLEELFELPNRQEELKYSALVMLDADGKVLTEEERKVAEKAKAIAKNVGFEFNGATMRW